MQRLAGVDDKNNYYEFIYIESIRRIIVWKDGKFKYVMAVKKEGNLQCPCFGFYGNVERKGLASCRHVDFCKDEFNFNKVNKPKAWLDKIREEYILLWYSTNKTIKRGVE